MTNDKRQENDCDSDVNELLRLPCDAVSDDQTESEFVEMVFGCYPTRDGCPCGQHVKQDKLKTVCHCAYGLTSPLHHATRRALNRFIVQINGGLDQPLPLIWI